MRRSLSRNARIALVALPFAAACALAKQGDPPEPDENLPGTAGDDTGGTSTGGSAMGGTSTGGSAMGGTSTGGSATAGAGGTSGGSSGSTSTGGSAGLGGSAGSPNGGSAGMTGGSAGKGGSGGMTGGSAGKGGSGGMTGGTGGTAGGPGGMTLFQDDFEMGASNWTNVNAGSAMWGIATDGSMVYRSTNAAQNSTFHGATAGEISWTNVRVQARIKVNSFAGSASDRYAGICVRYRDASNYYCLALRSNDHRVAFRQREGGSGSNTDASSTPFMDNAWYTVRVEAVGGNITAFVNDAQIEAGSRITGATITSGRIALAAPGVNATFDDVVVTSL